MRSHSVQFLVKLAVKMSVVTKIVPWRSDRSLSQSLSLKVARYLPRADFSPAGD